MEDSKELWLSLRKNFSHYDIALGPATAQGFVRDPRMLAFVASRYKFVSKMLAGVDVALEVGCCDAFGAPIVAQTVGRLICTDIDEEFLARDRWLCTDFHNIRFRYHDFRSEPYSEKVKAIFLVDVIEHIYPSEEQAFLTNLVRSLDWNGFLLLGTPNKTAEQYASKNSREGHVNLKTQDEWRETLKQYFHNVFMFGMNDEVVHTGYASMAQYVWGLGVGVKS